MVIEILIMKVLIYSGLFVALTTAVYAGSMPAEGPLFRILAGLDKPNQPTNENFDVNNPLGHAKVTPEVGDASSVLGGVSSDQVLASEENILDGATTASPVLTELSERESKEDLNFGPLAGTGPNEDESTVYKAGLDSKLGNLNQAAEVLNKANPNSAAAAA